MDLEMFKRMIEDQGKTLDKEDDWMPMIFMENGKLEDGTRGNVIAALGFDIGDDATKDLGCMVITQVIQKFSPDAVCFITVGWQAPPVTDEELKYAPRPSMNPDRKEVVLCMCVGRAGNSDGEVVLLGEINRSGDHPKITSWREMNGDADSQGKFPDAIRAGLQLNT